MKCTKCGCNLDLKRFSYIVIGKDGHYCHDCAVILRDTLELPIRSIGGVQSVTRRQA